MNRLRIALTIDPYLPVPPLHYGGIERMADILVRGLAARGHHVTLVAHPDSRPPDGGELVPYGVPPHWGIRPRATELWQVGSVLWQRRADFDVVHSCGRLAALLPILPLRNLPKLQTYQRDHVPWKSVRTAQRLGGASMSFVGCSASVYRERPPGPAWGEWNKIFNALELSSYAFAPQVAADAPFVFLGRIEPVKGTHHAIAIARAVGRRLIIAGNRIRTGPDAGYFDSEIAPHIDGVNVTYIGEVDDAAKSRVLGSAAALLMPTQCEEAFGLVIIEANACGTPAIGFARGGVKEVIRDGVNGWRCEDVAGAVAAVHKLSAIDRMVVRRDCEERFSADSYVSAHEQLYEARIRRCRASS